MEREDRFDSFHCPVELRVQGRLERRLDVLWVAKAEQGAHAYRPRFRRIADGAWVPACIGHEWPDTQSSTEFEAFFQAYAEADRAHARGEVDALLRPSPRDAPTPWKIDFERRERRPADRSPGNRLVSFTLRAMEFQEAMEMKARIEAACLAGSAADPDPDSKCRASARRL